jgi:trk system potassium uptake protein TrkH
LSRSRLLSPEALLPLTFLAAIVIGGGLLLLPGMSSGGVGWLEALFTATSAVCVTGLTVVDTGTEFSRQGQAVIAVLIQVGGLGIMTFSILALTLVGRRVSLGHEHAVRGTFTVIATWSLSRLLLAVIAVALLVEAIGFLALLLAGKAPFDAAFHAVSAFCNAGFSLHSDSLESQGAGVAAPILVLFVLGGLGFTTLVELARNARPRPDGRRRFTVHSRIVLKTSLILWLGGAALLWITERGSPGDALFMSASARTAGFDTTPVGELSGGALLALMGLMFIGASPGSTGGGIKTTTFALMLLLVRTVLRGRDAVTVYGRTIPRAILRRMFAVLVSSLAVVLLAVFLIDVFEGDPRHRFLELTFEVISAFGTVGLSTGVTPHLTDASKLLLCAVMFIGRVGSISLFVLLIRELPPSKVQYPEERILVG